MPDTALDPAYATARLRWKLYGTPVPGRLWVRRYPVSEPICPKVIKAQLRQIHWELLARQADRGHFQPERTQIMLRLRAMASPPTYGAAVGTTGALRGMRSNDLSSGSDLT